MKQNSIIEIGSEADVIISFNKETTINGKTYEALEPYLFLKNVKALLTYNQINKKVTRVSNAVAKNFASLNTLQLGNVTFSKKIASLLIKYVGSSSQKKRKFTTLIAYNGDPDAAIYMNEVFDETENYYVYDSSFNKITDIIYNEDSNSFSSPNFIDGEEYLISFSSGMTGEKFNLEQETQAYLNIKIQGSGNIDKKTKNILINIENASLKSMINFNFLPGEQVVAPLEFTIIDSEDNYIIFED